MLDSKVSNKTTIELNKTEAILRDNAIAIISS